MAKRNVNKSETVEQQIVPQPLQTPPVDTAGNTATEDTDETETEEGETEEREFTDSDIALLSDKQAEGVRAGKIKASWDVVTVSAKKSPTGKAGKRWYVRLEALDAAGLSQMFNGKIVPQTPADKIPEGTSKERREELTAKGACDYANYGFDLERRADARAKLLAELEGPEKVVKKAVASFQALDMDSEQIRTLILNSPKYKDVDGLAKIVDNALKA